MNDFRVVEKATQFPAECMLSFLGDGPMLDLGRDFDDIRNQGRMYMHVNYARQIGISVGMVDQSELEPLRAEIAERDERIAELERELAGLRDFKKSVYVMTSQDFRAQKKPGRPRKQPQGAA